MSNEKDVAPREGKDNFERTREVIYKKKNQNKLVTLERNVRKNLKIQRIVKQRA